MKIKYRLQTSCLVYFMLYHKVTRIMDNNISNQGTFVYLCAKETHSYFILKSTRFVSQP